MTHVQSNSLVKKVPFAASSKVAAALAGLGRTEDIKFSPNNRRLVILGYLRDRILLIDVDIRGSASDTTIDLVDCVEIESPEFHEPHGVAFVDDSTCIVANRRGLATVVELPMPGYKTDVVLGKVLGTIAGGKLARLNSPGSVAAFPVGDSQYEILICNNYVHYVTRHLLDTSHGFSIRRNRVLLRRGLKVPDGVAIGESGQWVAISNHYAQGVFLYRNTRWLNRYSSPTAILKGIDYPHGVRFTGDGRHVLVADAGAPLVHVFARPGTYWSGVQVPTASIRIMNDETFRRGQYNAEEGGPKGLDIDRSGGLLALTCEHQVLSFYDVAELLN